MQVPNTHEDYRGHHAVGFLIVGSTIAWTLIGYGAYQYFF